MELAGFELPAQGAPLDGRSIADLATGRRAPNPDAGDAFMAQIRDRSNPGGITAVVHGVWKLIEDGNKSELYNTRVDPDEKHDQSHDLAMAKILSDLRAELARRDALGGTSPFP
jgi:arylsulfatase A-like enzyme